MSGMLLNRLLRWILGGDLWYTMLLSMDIRSIETIKSEGKRSEQRKG